MTSKVIHYRDCTACKHRKSKFIPQRGRPKPAEIELCEFTKEPIPPPMAPGRYCSKFQQKDCECELCTQAQF